MEGMSKIEDRQQLKDLPTVPVNHKITYRFCAAPKPICVILNPLIMIFTFPSHGSAGDVAAGVEDTKATVHCTENSKEPIIMKQDH